MQRTIEENILRKSDQKRQLDWLAIQSGGFNTEFLQASVQLVCVCVCVCACVSMCDAKLGSCGQGCGLCVRVRM